MHSQKTTHISYLFSDISLSLNFPWSIDTELIEGTTQMKIYYGES